MLQEPFRRDTPEGAFLPFVTLDLGNPATPASSSGAPGGAGTDGLTRVLAVLPLLWLVGALATNLWLATGVLGTWRLRRQASAVMPAWMQRRLRRVLDEIGCAGRVLVRTSDRIVTPLLVGIIRPVVMIPTCLVTRLTPEQLELVLLHELAHLLRRDNIILLLQRLAESLLFFQPAVWSVSAWIRQEREHCCDTFVLRYRRDPRRYAETLLELADSVSELPALEVAMAGGQLAPRIRRVLNLEESPMPVSETVARSLLPIVLVIVIGLVTLTSPPAPRSPPCR